MSTRLITRTEMLPPLLVADPTFEDAWTAFLNDWNAGDIDRPYYQLLGDLARHLVQKLRNGETENFDAVFEVVEDWHLYGDEYVRTAATIGFLEDLQNENLHQGTEPAGFREWLRPESTRWWNKVERFWSTGEPIVDD